MSHAKSNDERARREEEDRQDLAAIELAQKEGGDYITLEELGKELGIEPDDSKLADSEPADEK